MRSEPTTITKHLAWATAVLGAFAIVGQACATEDTVVFGDPAKVVGPGGTSTGTTTTGGTCNPDPDCAIRFDADVFTPILEATASCAAPSCHQDSIGGFQYTADDAASAYAALLDYNLDGEGPYVVPCDPDTSTLLCNLRLEDGTDNPFGSCGVIMPRVDASDSVLDAPLTLEQLNTIAEWIACGAPEN